MEYMGYEWVMSDEYYKKYSRVSQRRSRLGPHLISKKTLLSISSTYITLKAAICNTESTLIKES